LINKFLVSAFGAGDQSIDNSKPKKLREKSGKEIGDGARTFLSAATPERAGLSNFLPALFRSLLLRTRMSDKNVRAPFNLARISELAPPDLPP